MSTTMGVQKYRWKIVIVIEKENEEATREKEVEGKLCRPEAPPHQPEGMDEQKSGHDRPVGKRAA